MRERYWRTAVAYALLLALTLTPAQAAQIGDGGPVQSQAEVTAAAVSIVSQTEGSHVKYMSGDGQGRFLPEKALTRGELAQMLYEIVADRPVNLPSFYDVAEDAWYAPAVRTVAGLGLMISDYSYFHPDNLATRAECAYALSQLLPETTPQRDIFPDVWPNTWGYEAICRMAGAGLFNGDERGHFRPADSLRRCEAVAVFNRLLGRTPDEQALAARPGLSPFSDVTPSHWAYGEILEATMTHQYAAVRGGESWLLPEIEAPAAPAVPASDAAGLPDGPQRINGHLYWVVDEKFVRSCNMSGLYFNENGWYTTGDEELDQTLNGLVEQYTDESMTLEEKLRALYNYVRDNYTYLKRPLITKGQTGWEAEYAKFFLAHGKGNCFNFAATYCLLSRELGQMSYVVVGRVLNGPHGWVEMPLDGVTYMFDTQLEWRYLHDYGKTGYNLFKMLPSKTPFRYTR